MATNQATRGDERAGHIGKHSLLTIPLEMFEAIAHAADPSDLINLRLVNRETKDKVQRVFIAVHFTQRMFLLSHRESLQALLGIAQHPLFGRALRTLFLCNEELPDANHVLIQDDTIKVSRWISDDADQAKTRTLNELQDREWKRITQDRVRFIESESNVQMLAQALETFRLAGNSALAVKVMEQSQAEMSAYGAKTLEILSGRTLIWGMDREQPVWTPFTALANASFPLTSLTIDFDNFGWGPHWFVGTNTFEGCVSKVFKTLKQIYFRFGDAPGYGPPDDSCRAAAFFNGCPVLEGLTLRLRTATNREMIYTFPYIRTVLTQGRMPNLTALNLQGFAFDAQCVVEFVAKNPQVEKVKFDNCRFLTDGVEEDDYVDGSRRHNECMQDVLQKATGLEDLGVVSSLVEPWAIREGTIQETFWDWLHEDEDSDEDEEDGEDDDEDEGDEQNDDGGSDSQ